MTIYPALLSDSREVIAQQLGRVQEAKNEQLETVQVDIIDGKFADNLTITPADFPDFEWGELFIDVHLMTEEPLDYVHELIDIQGQAPIRSVIAQVERMSNQVNFLEEVQKQGWTPGLSLDLFTPIDAIEVESMQFLKIIQIMGIEAGFQNQAFNPHALEKIKQLAQPCKNLEIELMVDGGVNLDTIGAITRAGAQSVAVGSALWKSSSISDTIEELQQASS